jgi:putative FmdB family regulatory protein
MPIREYICNSCGYSLEIILMPSERLEDVIPCPNCGERAIKVLPKTNFVLRGGGWAKDNYHIGKKSED